MGALGQSTSSTVKVHQNGIDEVEYNFLASITFTYTKSRHLFPYRQLTKSRDKYESVMGPCIIVLIYILGIMIPFYKVVLINVGPSKEQRGLLLPCTNNSYLLLKCITILIPSFIFR